MPSLTFTVVTVSDSCSRGECHDKSGPKLLDLVEKYFPNSRTHADIVSDDQVAIETCLKYWSERSDIIITTGGTGVSPRDVTPDATLAVIDREVPGISQTLLIKSLEVTDMAMLSRSVCGIRGKTLIVNFPGSAKAACECFDFVQTVFQHAVDLIHDKLGNVKKTHASLHQNQSVKVEVGVPKSKVFIPRSAHRNRTSPYKMIEVEEAINLIRDSFRLDDKYELVDLENAWGAILGENVSSVDSLPPFPASTKDGYAVIAADGAGVREVVNSVAAGDQPDVKILKPGQIVRINTGAPVPPGADAVVQVEDTKVHISDAKGEEITVEILKAPTVGQDIRPIGSDIGSDMELLKTGERLSSAHIGLLAAIGRTSVKIEKSAKIGILSTGNELQSPHESIKPGKIRDSNKLTLINLLKEYGYSSNDCGISKDNPDDVLLSFIKAFRYNDVVITTGGVSMGEHDVIKNVLMEDFGAEILFGRVNMKPGKPTTFARLEFEGKTKFVFGLPGNPVSASVTCILFVIPGLSFCSKAFFSHRTISVHLNEKLSLDQRPEYARATYTKTDDGRYVARTTGNQISSKLNSFVGANCLLILPGQTSEQKTLPKDFEVEAIILPTPNFNCTEENEI
ncbi:PREDICTED: gephyrin [Nicrophorus vespilloides]|uniref:Gephyrin n=1 Tax=Nicrophorus vespilloides TaxID=110193 RepID=A0ABM1NC29_NICVS|nr:PREDICTED: gephyrin [Nicrophorus vespilloides]XP_017784379.1 PREDICTED: gephyrin [Nicrophorus vespilloides]XP_017784380.1 PREDICTED: gephyrin [Nicrophorus vespilloides]